MRVKMEVVKTVFDKYIYNPAKPIGKGAFAMVYLVRDGLTKNEFACKIIDKMKYPKKRESLSQLSYEIDLHKRLNHQNIVKFYEAQGDDNHINILLEYCNNGDLATYLNKRKHLTVSEVRSFFIDIVSGVDYLHKYSIIHRDLKLTNILLDNRMCAKICDMGLAIKVTQSQKLRVDCGTPNYMAPEVITCKDTPESGYSFGADIWSLGVILYVLAIGKLPFESLSNIDETRALIKRGVYRVPSTMDNNIKDLISKMLVLDPSQRITMTDIKKHAFLTTTPPILKIKTSERIIATSLCHKYSKYGVCYKLSNNILGVYYKNDNKILLNPYTGEINYHYGDKFTTTISEIPSNELKILQIYKNQYNYPENLNHTESLGNYPIFMRKSNYCTFICFSAGYIQCHFAEGINYLFDLDGNFYSVEAKMDNLTDQRVKYLMLLSRSIYKLYYFKSL